MSLLPTRDHLSEKNFLESIQKDPQIDTLYMLLTEALEQKRIQLAAKIFLLLPLDEQEQSHFGRAKQAAQLLLIEAKPEQVLIFSDAWSAYQQRKRVAQIKNRMRPKSPFQRRRPR